MLQSGIKRDGAMRGKLMVMRLEPAGI